MAIFRTTGTSPLQNQKIVDNTKTIYDIQDLKDLSAHVYTPEEIKTWRVDESIEHHPLAHKHTSVRSKLAFREIMRVLTPTKKYCLPGQVVLFKYNEPKYKDELEAGTEYEKNKDIYERYFTVKETPKRGRKVDYNHQAIEDFINNDSCYWVLMSTTQKDKKKALLEYRDRNGVEVNLDDVKNSMDLRRMRNHSERTIKGKIFVIFIALILLTKLRVMVQSTPQKDRHYWTERDFLEKVASFSKVHFEGKYKDVYSVPTSSQRFVFDKLEIPYTYKGKMFNEKGGEKKVDAQAYKANTNGNAESKNNQTADELGST